MPNIAMNDLLEAGVHFGHMTRKWNPKMKQYIFTARDGVHVIDLAITVEKLKEAAKAIEDITASGKEVLLVGTKRQASVVLSELGEKYGIPYIAQRWLGGLLTNYDSVQSTWNHLNDMQAIMDNKAEFEKMTTRDQFALRKEYDKLFKLVGGLRNITQVPGAVFVVDVKREQTALTEAKKMGVPVFALVDTNVDPKLVDFPIPGNDDAIKSIEIITEFICKVIEENKKAPKISEKTDPAPKKKAAKVKK